MQLALPLLSSRSFARTLRDDTTRLSSHAPAAARTPARPSHPQRRHTPTPMHAHPHNDPHADVVHADAHAHVEPQPRVESHADVDTHARARARAHARTHARTEPRQAARSRPPHDQVDPLPRVEPHARRPHVTHPPSPTARKPVACSTAPAFPLPCVVIELFDLSRPALACMHGPPSHRHPAV